MSTSFGSFDSQTGNLILCGHFHSIVRGNWPTPPNSFPSQRYAASFIPCVLFALRLLLHQFGNGEEGRLLFVDVKLAGEID